ncbi:hypothetical protein D3C85_1279600 [compost metagenome]
MVGAVNHQASHVALVVIDLHQVAHNQLGGDIPDVVDLDALLGHSTSATAVDRLGQQHVQRPFIVNPLNLALVSGGLLGR